MKIQSIWKGIFRLAAGHIKNRGLKEKNIKEAIFSYRSRKRSKVHNII